MIEKKPIGMLSPRSIQVSTTNHKFSDHRNAISPNQTTNESQFISQKYDKRRQTDNGIFGAENNLLLQHQDKSEHLIKRTPHYSGSTNLGEDVRDALREFDYLNDYDESSVRNDTIPHNNNPTAIYHF